MPVISRIVALKGKRNIQQWIDNIAFLRKQLGSKYCGINEMKLRIYALLANAFKNLNYLFNTKYSII